jgi:hypothetical protein
MMMIVVAERCTRASYIELQRRQSKVEQKDKSEGFGQITLKRSIVAYELYSEMANERIRVKI